MTPAPGMVVVKLFEDSNAVVQSADRNYERVGEVLQKYCQYTGPFNSPEELEVGDIIFFDEYAYRRFTWKDQDYCIVNISEPGCLWGVIKKQDASTNEKPLQETGLPTPVSNGGEAV